MRSPLLTLPFALWASTLAAQDAQPNYHGDVAPIVQKRCQVCHRPNAIGPFSLLTYRDALGNSAMIEEVVRNRRMPPWHADAETTPLFSNARSLSEAERKTILDWVAAECPPGDKAKAPAPLTWRDPAAFAFEPDAVFQTPYPFKVPAEGVVDYQYYLVPTSFPEDRWITDWQVTVDAPGVVHHVLGS